MTRRRYPSDVDDDTYLYPTSFSARKTQDSGNTPFGKCLTLSFGWPVLERNGITSPMIFRLQKRCANRRTAGLKQVALRMRLTTYASFRVLKNPETLNLRPS